jgi:two-component system response regulator HydG
MVKATNGFVGASGALTDLLADAELVAPRDTTVLLTGESGTGKELVARHIHRLSSRRDGPYVTCDCAALTPSLCEGELFGYRRGAFTGALRDSPGYLPSSHEGTLFLDEVGELGPASQTRLLRFLGERTVVSLGDVRPRRLDVRIIAATNRNLEEMVAAGRFREDLYFRLNVVNLRLTPLRDRVEDVLPLAEYFRRHFAVRHEKRVVGFTPQAEQALRAWRWPGNVRELKNAVERAVVLCRGTWIDRDDLPAPVLQPEEAYERETGASIGAAEGSPRDLSFQELTREFQRRLLTETLGAVQGNRREAARRLRLTPHQLKYLIGKLGLSRS